MTCLKLKTQRQLGSVFECWFTFSNSEANPQQLTRLTRILLWKKIDTCKKIKIIPTRREQLIKSNQLYPFFFLLIYSQLYLVRVKRTMESKQVARQLLMANWPLDKSPEWLDRSKNSSVFELQSDFGTGGIWLWLCCKYPKTQAYKKHHLPNCY